MAKRILILSLIVVIGYFALIVGGALLDVWGLQKDLDQNANELTVECVGDEDCQIIEQIEYIRQLHDRHVEIDYDALDYSAQDNELIVEGKKVIDFKFAKYVWHFQFTVDLVK